MGKSKGKEFPSRGLVWVFFIPIAIVFLFVKNEVESPSSGSTRISKNSPKIYGVSVKKESIKTEEKFRLPIVMYHYIEHVKDRGDRTRIGLNILPETLDREIKELKNAGYESLYIRDIPAILSGVTPYSPKVVFLTFDDGYEDFYTDAFPILKKNNTKATIYIVDHFIGRPGYMNGKQLREIIDSNLVEIGAHSLNHAKLTSLSLPDAKKQIEESKRNIENRFGITIQTFAYPYGSFNTDIIKLVQSAGFSSGVSVDPGIEQSNENLFSLSRIRAGVLSGSNSISKLENYQKK